MFFSDLWTGVSAGLGQVVASAAVLDRAASGGAVHPSTLLPREPTLPAHQPQRGRAGTQR